MPQLVTSFGERWNGSQHLYGQGHSTWRFQLKSTIFHERQRHTLLLANDGSVGYELWKSDGTNAGTVLVEDIRSGSFDSNAEQLTNVGGTLYFRADDGVAGYEL